MRTASILFTGLAMGILLATEARACRCAQQTLEQYFEGASEVFLAHVTAYNPDESGSWQKLDLKILGEAFKGEPYDSRTWLTGSSSASCGIAVPAGTVILAFAQRDSDKPDTAYLTTCNGTRTFDPSADEGANGFVNAPASEVLKRLLDLRGTNNKPVPQSPSPGQPSYDPIIGLLALNKQAPALHSSPCGATRSKGTIMMREISYEQAGAVVLATTPGWYRVAVTGVADEAWIRQADAGAFHSLADLLPNRLNFLTAEWNGELWAAPGTPPVRAVALNPDVRRNEYPANIIAARTVGEALWLEVEVLDGNQCSGVEPSVAAHGWIPAWSESGKVTAWYWSRGC